MVDEEKSKEKGLEKLKRNYSQLQLKYDLPGFEKLNEDFSIEKLSEVETDYLLREIIRFISEKISNYFRVVESLINPVNVPMFNYTIVKALGVEEKNKLNEIYKKLSKVEVDLIELDIEHLEEREALFLKGFYFIWQDVKKDILEIFKVVRRNWDNKKEDNGKGYFG